MTTTNNTNKTANTDIVSSTQFVDEILEKIEEQNVVESTAIVQPQEEVIESSVQPKHKKARKTVTKEAQVVDERVQAERDVLLTPTKVKLPEELQFAYGEKKAIFAYTIGNRSILKGTKLAAVTISLKSSKTGIALCKLAAQSIASHGANLLTVGAHDEIKPAINAALAGGANIAIVLPHGIDLLDVKPWMQQICEGRICFISPLGREAKQVWQNNQVANMLAAKLAYSLFIGECYATQKFADGSRASKIWHLAQAVDAEDKNIFIPTIHEKSRTEHSDLVKAFEAIQVRGRSKSSDVIGEDEVEVQEESNPFSILTQEIVDEEEIVEEKVFLDTKEEAVELDLGSLEDVAIEDLPL